MAQVVWTENATDDIETIATYIEQFSIHYASLVVKKLYKEVGLLEQFPQMGRIIPELNDARFREIVRDNYRIMYEVFDEIILIQRILHSSRLFNHL